MAKEKMTDEELEREFEEALHEIRERNLAAVRAVAKAVNAVTFVLIALLGFLALLAGGGCVVAALISLLTFEFDAAALFGNVILFILGAALIAVSMEAATYVLD